MRTEKRKKANNRPHPGFLSATEKRSRRKVGFTSGFFGLGRKRKRVVGFLVFSNQGMG